MPKTLQLRRDIDANVSVLTGAAGEPIVDTTNFKLSIHDGVTPGGHKVVQENGAFVGISGEAAYRNLGTANTVQYIAPVNEVFPTTIPNDTVTNTLQIGGYPNGQIEFAFFSPNNYAGNTSVLIIDLQETDGSDGYGISGVMGQELLQIKSGDTVTINFRAPYSGGSFNLDLYSFETTVVYDAEDAYTFLYNKYTSGGGDARYFGTIGTPGGGYEAQGSMRGFSSGRFIALEVNNPIFTSIVGQNSGQTPDSNYIGYRTYYNGQYTLNVSRATQLQENYFYTNYLPVGGTSLEYVVPGGTIGTFTPSVYNDLLRYNGSIVSNYGENNYGTLSPYTLGINQLILNSTNVVSQISNTTVFQTYAGTNFAPTLQIGQNLEIIENPFTGNTMMNGQLVKVLGYQDFGPISNTFTQTALVPYTSLNPSWPGSQSAIAGSSPYDTVNNWIFPQSNGAAWWFLNTNTELTNALMPFTSTGQQLELTYSSNTNTYVVTLASANGFQPGGTFEFGDNNYGFFNTPSNWVSNFQFSLVSIKKNGIDYTNNWSYYTDWNQGTYPSNTLFNLQIEVSGIALGINVATTAGMTNTTPLLVDNYQFTPQIIDSTNNTVVLSASASTYANINLIGSAVTTNTYSSPYATIEDINLNLPTWVKTAYTSGHVAYNPSITFQTLKYYDDPNNTYQIYSPGLGDITNNGYGTSTPLYTLSYNKVNQSYATPHGWSTQQPWTAASLYAYYGDIATQYGVFANTVYGVTSVVTPTLQATNVNTTNVSSSLVTSSQIKVLPDPNSYDPYFANVQYLLSGSLTPGGLTNQGNGGTIASYVGGVSNPNSSGVPLPSGAPATANVVSIGLGQSIIFNNSMTQDIGSSQHWTIETWYYTPWIYSTTYFLVDVNQNNKFNVNWDYPYYPEIWINNSYALDAYTGMTEPENIWTHYAFVRDGNNYYAFVNGNIVATGTYGNTQTPSTVGDQFAISPNCYGGSVYLYNYRVTVGNARYTTNFTPTLQSFPTSGVVPTLNNAIELQGGFKLDNIGSVPSDTPSSGGYLFVQGGVLKYKGSNGTVTTIANA